MQPSRPRPGELPLQGRQCLGCDRGTELPGNVLPDEVEGEGPGRPRHHFQSVQGRQYALARLLVERQGHRRRRRVRGGGPEPPPTGVRTGLVPTRRRRPAGKALGLVRAFGPALSGRPRQR
ncbi:hypothetical protein GCM10010377_69150 [Streptomyces viridiviolaceus]|nr:hypothetical protein GCM10010377_69150 [Streptomyces viridiviolaceus]